MPTDGVFLLRSWIPLFLVHFIQHMPLSTWYQFIKLDTNCVWEVLALWCVIHLNYSSSFYYQKQSRRILCVWFLQRTLALLSFLQVKRSCFWIYSVCIRCSAGTLRIYSSSGADCMAFVYSMCIYLLFWKMVTSEWLDLWKNSLWHLIIFHLGKMLNFQVLKILLKHKKFFFSFFFTATYSHTVSSFPEFIYICLEMF